MSAYYLLTLVVCSLVVASLGHPAGEDGQWVDDVSNNREVMGLSDGEDFPVAHKKSDREDDDGEWMDDVTGNLLVMGEDPLTQARGMDDMNSERKKRSPSKKNRKGMKKSTKRN